MFCHRHFILSSALSVFLACSAHAEDSDFVSSRGGSLQTMAGVSAPPAARDELAPPVPQEQDVPVSSEPAKPHVHPQPQVPAGWSSLSDPSIGAGGVGASGFGDGEMAGYPSNTGNTGGGHPVPQIPAGYTQVGGYDDGSGIQGMPSMAALQGAAAGRGYSANGAAGGANFGALISSLMRYVGTPPGQVGGSGQPYVNGFAQPNMMNINCGAGMTPITTPAGVVCR